MAARRADTPVDLIQIGDIYFVRDGHHRISVERTLGQKEIEAMVIIFQLVETPAAEPKDRANTHPAIPTALPVPWQFLTEQL